MKRTKISISLDSFRCFAHTEDIRIAPITILVGENSSGKTSFLAALRRLFESFFYSSQNSFNKDPYFLGSFEQIAHFRGGKAGRAKDFTLSLRLEESDEAEDLFLRQRNSGSLRFATRFKKGRSQPEIETFFIDVNDLSASIDVSGTKIVINLTEKGEAILQSLPLDFGSAILHRDPSFLMYMLNDIIRRTEKEHALSELQSKTLQKLTNGFTRASRDMNKTVFASAPVRIQPRRVYTPSELTSTNAGEQVPLQMANQKLVSPTAWKAMKAKLVEFGSRSGLFEDIEVKRFGKSDGDPFQLQIKNIGPAANIVDVGYGVSQALPLIYPLYAESESDVYLLQQPEVHLHPKAQAEFGSLICELSKQNPEKFYVLETHSDFIIDRIRSEVRNGNIDCSTINIVYFSRRSLDVEIFQISLDEKGSIANYPENYREFFLREQARVLGV